MVATVSPTIQLSSGDRLITVAGGCFWGLDQLYSKQYLGHGLTDAKVGYANGQADIESPSYERVCEGDTNYAEVLQIAYDPEKLSLKELVSFFYRIHDPTTVNAQGKRNRGTQYRSAIFYHNPSDLDTIRSVTVEFEKKWGAPIVTQIEQIESFYDAEEYHQQYLTKNVDGYHCDTHFIRDFD